MVQVHVSITLMQVQLLLPAPRRRKLHLFATTFLFIQINAVADCVSLLLLSQKCRHFGDPYCSIISGFLYFTRTFFSWQTRNLCVFSFVVFALTRPLFVVYGDRFFADQRRASANYLARIIRQITAWLSACCFIFPLFSFSDASGSDICYQSPLSRSIPFPPDQTASYVL